MAEWKKVIVSGSRAELQDASGSFSGSFEGDGSGLTNVPASGVVGLNLTQIATTNVTASVSEGTDSFKLVSGSETPFKIGNDGVMTGTGSGLIDLKATETDLQQELTTNQTVGGVSSGETFAVGTDVEDILRQILITYIPPSFGAPSMKNGASSISTSTREVGESFTANTASFTATADNPNGNFPFSASFTSSGASISDVEVYFGDDVLGSSNGLGIGNTYTYTRNSEGNINFKINGVNSENAGSVTSQRNYNFKYKQFFGATTSQVTNSTGVRSLSNSNFTNTNSFTTPTFDEIHFTIAIPNNKTLTSVITANNENITSQFINSTFNVQDGGGNDVSYNVYRFSSAEALNVTATVTLS